MTERTGAPAPAVALPPAPIDQRVLRRLGWFAARLTTHSPSVAMSLRARTAICERIADDLYGDTPAADDLERRLDQELPAAAGLTRSNYATALHTFIEEARPR
ncbi:hypothetical protein J3A78_003851 [Streptomyces sp. PvR006]|uniref:hypothetical protein n=1 Tax=Streptomyces sp. PvR006 TaxID=2817860 RepID=UPI001AE263A7|nr:hypothetical protein [Streptomyces sp. PvR006]MBP2583373.1 hypothetical protein [Streptomyces sp. PvR006]